MKHHQAEIDPSEWDAFDRIFKSMGLTPTSPQRTKFQTFCCHILNTSQSLNLLSSNDLYRIPTRHILDSLWSIYFDLIPPKANTFDLGAGAGFPGIPLAIIRPDLQITLIESNLKKAAFLQQLTKTLDLPNASVINARIESLNHTHTHKYDIGVVRAVTNLTQIWQWGSPLLRSGGKMICYKGPKYRSEMTSLTPNIPQTEPYSLRILQTPHDLLPIDTTIVELTKPNGKSTR